MRHAGRVGATAGRRWGAWKPLRGVAPYGDDDGASWWRAALHGLVALLAMVITRQLLSGCHALPPVVEH